MERDPYRSAYYSSPGSPTRPDHSLGRLRLATPHPQQARRALLTPAVHRTQPGLGRLYWIKLQIIRLLCFNQASVLVITSLSSSSFKIWNPLAAVT